MIIGLLLCAYLIWVGIETQNRENRMLLEIAKLEHPECFTALDMGQDKSDA
jgi:hypothetical protein